MTSGCSARGQHDRGSAAIGGNLPTRLAFVHINKAGGTTVAKLMEQCIPDSWMLHQDTTKVPLDGTYGLCGTSSA